jgi:hypothetical protein
LQQKLQTNGFFSVAPEEPLVAAIAAADEAAKLKKEARLILNFPPIAQNNVTQ